MRGSPVGLGRPARLPAGARIVSRRHRFGASVVRPTNRQEPLAGVDFWLSQIQRPGRPLIGSILVGARTDRGSPTLTSDEIDAYCRRQGITGGHVATSATTGHGISKLVEAVKAEIPWDEMISTVTTTTFKRIKEYVLSLKEYEAKTTVLLDPAELRRRMEELDADWKFSDDELMAAVGHLQTHGYITVVRGSNGQESVLLSPDVLTNLAASFVLEARRNPRGLGVLDEERLLRGDYPFPELVGLITDDQEVLLDAATLLFIERNICFRETFNEQTFLVFLSLINEKKPPDDDVEIVEDVTYRVRGAVENVYASLVVLLGYTNTFIRTNQWQNQARYETDQRAFCGFRQMDHGDGEIELVLYYQDVTPEYDRATFRGLFERFLSRRDIEISRYQPVICGKCGERLARVVVLGQLDKERDFSYCNSCGARLNLPPKEVISVLFHSNDELLAGEQDITARRTAFEAALVRVKGILRGHADEDERSTCFISYAWGVADHERWVLQLANDLQNSGVDVLLDRWHSTLGDDIGRFTDRIMSSKFVLVVGTPNLLVKYNEKSSDPVVAAELDLINLRLRERNKYGPTVIPLLLDGEPEEALTPQLQKLVRSDFRDLEEYFVNLFNLIWRLHELPAGHLLQEELRQSMAPTKGLRKA